MVFATDRRIIFLDKGIVSLKFEEFRYPQVTSIEFETKLLMGAVTFTVAGNRKEIQAAPKAEVKPFVDTVKAEIAKTKTAAPNTSAEPRDVVDQLQKLASLKVQGILTEEEFIAQKAKLLA